MKSPQLTVTILLVLSALLVAYSLSLPLWVPKVPGTVVTVDAQVILGLVAFIVGVLALVGAAVFIMIRNEVRKELESEIAARLQIQTELTNSRIFYLAYNQILTQAAFDPAFLSNIARPAQLWFEDVLSNSISYARLALEHSSSLPDSHHSRRLLLDISNDLAYHLATRYFFQKDERDKQEAMKLKEALTSNWNLPHHLESISWIDIICNRPTGDDLSLLIKQVDSLVNSDDRPRRQGELLRLKYTNLLNVSFPSK